MPGPWEKYGGAAVADPIVKQADPYKAEDQSFQRNAEARAAEAATRSAEKDARETRTYDATHNADGSPKPNADGGKPTESNGKAAAFLTRALGANSLYGSVDNIGPRSLIGQQMADRAPSVLNTLPSAIGNSPERQRADQAQREFIAAVLRMDSGAAITPDELTTNQAVYFPQPGDGPDAIAQKAAARARAIDGLRQEAGPLGDQAVPPVVAPINGQDADSQGLSYANPGVNGAGVVTDQGGPPTPPPGGGLDPRFYNPSGGQGIVDLAKQGISLGLSDEAAGIGGMLSSAFTGEDPAAAYSRERDMERRNLSEARKAHPIVGTAAEFLGGGGAARIAALPSGIAQVIRQGAGIGATGGFGYGEGSQSVPNALLGAAGGAGLGAALYGAGSGVNALTRLRSGPAPDMEVVAAGQRQNIPIRQPDARPDMRNQAAQVETTQTGGPMIREARAADQTAIESRIAEVGGDGAVGDPYALGSKVQEAGSRYIARTKQQANRLYERARTEANGATVQPTEAVAAIDSNIAELKAAGENSNGGLIKYLEGLRADLSKPLSIEAVQNLRTNMRGQISERGLTNTDAERRVGQVISAANMDLTRELPQSASTALRSADDFYRNRQEFINGTLKQFMGNKGNPLPAETAASRLLSMTQGKGNFDRFSSMWKELEPAERSDVAATVAASLGRKANGEFSASTLLRSLDPVKGVNPRTARMLFGEDGAKALDDLRVIAKAKSDTGQAMNSSRTGVVVSQTVGNLKTMLMAAFGFSTGGAGGAAVGAVSREFLSRWGEQRAARMLLNPDFTKWLRNAPNATNPHAIDRYFSRLAGMGSIAANDNQAFTQALIAAVRKSPGRAAAQDGADSGREPPK